MAYETFKVLIADDDPIIRTIYDRTLRDQHYQVVLAADGEETLQKAFVELPDIVLLDIMMPKLDGYKVCTRLRTAPATADIPIMILTALSGTSARQKAHDVGADDFVTKGGPIESVEGRIKMLLKRRVLAHTRSWLAGLPGTVAADYALHTRLEQRQPATVCYLDIDGLRGFNDLFGYEHGDRVLWKLARVLNAVVQQDNQGDFCAYLGAGRFLFITLSERAEELVRSILDAYGGEGNADAGMPTLSVAMVQIGGGTALHPAQVEDLARVLLAEAKAAPGSAVRIGRL